MEKSIKGLQLHWNDGECKGQLSQNSRTFQVDLPIWVIDGGNLNYLYNTASYEIHNV